jgi:hypothetical protein
LLLLLLLLLPPPLLSAGGPAATQALRGDAGWEDGLRRAAKHLAETLILTERARHEQQARPLEPSALGAVIR